jgi:hypothetical protein
MQSHAKKKRLSPFLFGSSTTVAAARLGAASHVSRAGNYDIMALALNGSASILGGWLVAGYGLSRGLCLNW